MKLLSQIKNLFVPNDEVILSAALKAAKAKRLDIAEKIEDANVNLHHLQAMRVEMDKRITRLQSEKDRF